MVFRQSWSWSMEDNEQLSADLHSAAKTAFDSLLVPNGFKRTADWIDVDRAGHSGREYARDAVRVRLDWDERGAFDVRLARVRFGQKRRVLGWEDLETIAAGAPSHPRPLSQAEQRARVERLVKMASEVLELRKPGAAGSGRPADLSAGA
jgi:hypothetical protein